MVGELFITHPNLVRAVTTAGKLANHLWVPKQVLVCIAQTWTIRSDDKTSLVLGKQITIRAAE